MQTNCYILSEMGQCIVIDAGSEGVRIADIIEESGMKVNYFLATHGHFDHVAGINELRARFDCPFHLHRDDLYLLHSAHEMSTKFTGSNIEPVMEPDGFITGEKYIIGETSILPLHTPGHTKGSVSFLADGLLFSGDTLFKGSIGRTDFGGSTEVMRKTVEKLKGFDNNMVVYPGHGEKTTIGEEKRSNPFLTYLDW